MQQLHQSCFLGHMAVSGSSVIGPVCCSRPKCTPFYPIYDSMTNLLFFLIAGEQEGKADVILSFPKVCAVFLIGVLSLTNLSVAAVTNVTSVAQIQGTCTTCRICNVPEGQFPAGWFTLAYRLRILNANSSFSFLSWYLTYPFSSHVAQLAP